MVATSGVLRFFSPTTCSVCWSRDKSPSVIGWCASHPPGSYFRAMMRTRRSFQTQITKKMAISTFFFHFELLFSATIRRNDARLRAAFPFDDAPGVQIPTFPPLNSEAWRPSALNKRPNLVAQSHGRSPLPFVPLAVVSGPAFKTTIYSGYDVDFPRDERPLPEGLIPQTDRVGGCPL